MEAGGGVGGGGGGGGELEVGKSNPKHKNSNTGLQFSTCQRLPSVIKQDQ